MTIIWYHNWSLSSRNVAVHRKLTMALHSFSCNDSTGLRSTLPTKRSLWEPDPRRSWSIIPHWKDEEKHEFLFLEMRISAEGQKVVAFGEIKGSLNWKDK